MEAKLQSEIIKWLKNVGCYVIKTRVLPGVPVGCPDIIVLRGEKWMAIEVKAKPKAPFRTGQVATLEHLRKGNKFVYVVNPLTWPMLKQDIVNTFL